MQDSLKYKINYKLVVFVVGGKSERKYVARLVRQYPFFMATFMIMLKQKIYKLFLI